MRIWESEEEWEQFYAEVDHLMGRSKRPVAGKICSWYLNQNFTWVPDYMAKQVQSVFKNAEKGDAACQLLIGKSYYELEDYQSARVWLQKAADQGAPGAADLLDGVRIGTGEYHVGSGCMVFVAVLFVSLIVVVFGGVEIGALI